VDPDTRYLIHILQRDGDLPPRIALTAYDDTEIMFTDVAQACTQVVSWLLGSPRNIMPMDRRLAAVREKGMPMRVGEKVLVRRLAEVPADAVFVVQILVGQPDQEPRANCIALERNLSHLRFARALIARLPALLARPYELVARHPLASVLEGEGPWELVAPDPVEPDPVEAASPAGDA